MPNNRNRTIRRARKLESYAVENPLIEESHPVQERLLIFHLALHSFAFLSYTWLSSAFPKSRRFSNHGFRISQAPRIISKSAPCNEVSPINSANPPNKERTPKNVVKPLIRIL